MQERYAVITGGSSGLGAEYARLLAKRGYSVLITGRRPHALASVAESITSEIDARVETLVCELSNEEDLERLCRRIASLDPLEWLINNAGFGLEGDIVDGDILARREMVRVHVDAPMVLTRIGLEKMIPAGAGRIVNVGSLASLLAVPGASVYTGTKAFLLRFTESVALEAQAAGVRLQVLLPGYFRSDFHRDYGWTDADKRSRGLIRWMEAADVARSSLRAIERRRPGIVHVPGLANRIAYVIAQLVPRRFLYIGVRRRSRGRPS